MKNLFKIAFIATLLISLVSCTKDELPTPDKKEEVKKAPTPTINEKQDSTFNGGYGDM